MTVPNRVKVIKHRYENGMILKRRWFSIFQLIGEYVLTRKQNFHTNAQPGDFLTEQLFRDDSLVPSAWFSYSSRITGDIFYL